MWFHHVFMCQCSPTPLVQNTGTVASKLASELEEKEERKRERQRQRDDRAAQARGAKPDDPQSNEGASDPSSSHCTQS